MKERYFISGIVLFSFSLLMFFIVSIVIEIPLSMNIVDDNGFESNKIPLNIFSIGIPSLSALIGIIFLLLSNFKESK